MTLEERIAQLERDVTSLQACNNAAQTEIHLLRDKVIPDLKRQVNEEMIPELNGILGRIQKRVNAVANSIDPIANMGLIGGAERRRDAAITEQLVEAAHRTE